MRDSRRENAWFSLKWGILVEKTRDFQLNGGFAKTRDFLVKWGILEKKTHDFRLNGGFSKIKTRDFRLNGGFAKRKRVIFA